MILPFQGGWITRTFPSVGRCPTLNYLRASPFYGVIHGMAFNFSSNCLNRTQVISYFSFSFLPNFFYSNLPRCTVARWHITPIIPAKTDIFLLFD